MTLLRILGVLIVLSVCSSVCDGEELDPLPTKSDYKASSVTYDDGGMGPMFDFARSFIDTSLPGGFPLDLINKTMGSFMGKGDSKQSFDIQDTGMKLLKMYMGYVVAIGIGILFFLIFPIVGLCFCCCRLAGNCGGKRTQETDPKMHCKKWVYTSVMFVIAVFTLTGNICTYVSNDRMSVALEKLGGSVADNLDDIDAFLNLLELQIHVTGEKNLQKMKRSVLDLFIGHSLQDQISDFVLKNVTEGALVTMESNINTTKEVFEKVNSEMTKIQSLYHNLCPGITPCAIPDPTATLHHFQSMQYSQFKTFAAHDVVKKVKTKVSTEIDTHLSGITNLNDTVNKSFVEMQPQVDDLVKTVKEFIQDARGGVNTSDYKQQVKSISKDIRGYDKYRFIAGTVLAAMTTIIVTLQMVGLAMGMLGQGISKVEPGDRGCVSNSGGNMLMASVVFIFLFASLLMLLTTISFAIGAILERFVCQPLSDPDLKLLQVADAYVPTKESLGIGLSDVMKNCKEDQSAYNAFNLSSKINMSSFDSILNAKKKEILVNVGNKLHGLDTGLGSMSLDTLAGPSLQNFKDSVNNVQFTTINTQLDNLATSLQPVRSTPPAAKLLESITKLKTNLETLHKISGTVDSWSTDLTQSLAAASTKLSSHMGPLVDGYVNHAFGTVENFVNTTKKAVVEEVGRCSPLWNLYNSILIVSVCDYTVDSFNGFWFSIGWCIFFFIPGVIFAVKLAKHYRRMEPAEPEIEKNKVAHSDDVA